MRAVRSRIILSGMVISVVMAVGLWPAAVSATAVSSGMSATEKADRATPAGAVIADLTGALPGFALQSLPIDFAALLHYRPVVIDEMPTDPGGACSSPIPLPDHFESLCQTHDFGYDLLRYAEYTGQPLGPWARTALDRMLIDRMHMSCTDTPCHWAADLARIGLAFNTWRQHGGAPVAKEPLTSIVMTTVLRGAESLTALVGLR